MLIGDYIIVMKPLFWGVSSITRLSPESGFLNICVRGEDGTGWPHYGSVLNAAITYELKTQELNVQKTRLWVRKCLFWLHVYVYIEVALRGVPMERVGQLSMGEGPIKSQPRGTIDTVSRTLDHTHAHTGMCVF